MPFPYTFYFLFDVEPVEAVITRWVFDYGGNNQYTFTRNPDRSGGDSGWMKEMRYQEISILGASLPTYHIDNFNSSRRIVRFSLIDGAMMRVLQDFYLKGEVINNCRDHLYGSNSSTFSCFIVEFLPSLHPTLASEDTWDLEMTLLRTG